MTRLLPAMLLALLLEPSAIALPPPSALEIGPLIQQLGSDRYVEREAASKKLEVFGERALPVLRKARHSKDAEVRKRASLLIEVVERPLLVREEKKLRGTWQVVSDERGGIARRNPRLKTEYVFSGRAVRRTHDEGGRTKSLSGAYEVNRVGVIDVRFKAKVAVPEQISQIIYKVEKGMLVLCYSSDGGPAPEKFETKEGTNLVLITLKRRRP
jgi:uncharacterized protein (TIGR03067 family)